MPGLRHLRQQRTACFICFEMLTLAVSLQTENSPDAALDMLTDPEAEGALQVSIMERRERRHERRKRARVVSNVGANNQASAPRAHVDEPAAGGAAAPPSHEATAEAGPHPPAVNLLQDGLEVSHDMSHGTEHSKGSVVLEACFDSLLAALQNPNHDTEVACRLSQ